jgi:hypothetical protein
MIPARDNLENSGELSTKELTRKRYPKKKRPKVDFSVSQQGFRELIRPTSDVEKQIWYLMACTYDKYRDQVGAPRAGTELGTRGPQNIVRGSRAPRVLLLLCKGHSTGVIGAICKARSSYPLKR